MSRENVELVERMLALFHEGDAESALACFSPDVVIDATTRPDGTTGRGRQELATIIGDWVGAFEDWTEETEEIREVGDQVLVVATQRGRGRASGIEVETRYATVYGVRGGEIVSVTLYRNAEEAIRSGSG